jgi:hypothetical protein
VAAPDVGVGFSLLEAKRLLEGLAAAVPGGCGRDALDGSGARSSFIASFIRS